MRPATALAGFALVLTAVFAVSVGIGRAVGPVGTAGTGGGAGPAATMPGDMGGMTNDTGHRR